MTKQISLTIPDVLFEASKEQYEVLGYKNMQEFILDLLRKRVLIENLQRYRQIEEKMKKGIGVKRFNQKDAIRYLNSLRDEG